MAIFSCDIETDGLDPTIIWCIVCTDVRTGRNIAFYDDGKEEYPLDWRTLENFQAWMDENVNTLIFHNGYGFDVPVMQRLLDVDFSNVKVEDTQLMSYFEQPQREGGHSLASWGERLGFAKGDHSDWSCFSEEMLTYCIRDTEVTAKLWNYFDGRFNERELEALELEYQIKTHCAEQEYNGWAFDINGAERLMMTISNDITDQETEVRKVFKPKPVFHELKKAPKFTKTGAISKRYQTQLEKGCFFNQEGKWGYNQYREFNLGSRTQIAEYLQDFGWKPTVFTEKGNVKIDDEILEGVDIPEVKMIARYLMLAKRRSMLKSWIEAYNPETKALHGRVRTIGTVTHRMSSNNPNMQQVVASDKEYGHEMRSLFVAREGKVIVGADLSGLEIRCLAHYMNDPEYTEEVLNGDVHTKNQKSAGLPTRASAKTFIYAFLYGGGDELIGNIVGGGRKEGKKIKNKFIDSIPSLANLRRLAEAAADNRGFVFGLDGRKIYTRSSHSALNFLLQSAGAIIAKRAWANFYDSCTLPYKQLGVIHDELQLEVDPKDADAIGELLIDAMRKVTEDYNLRCPMDGEYKIGNNWSETH